MDLQMPVMDGFTTTRYIRKNLSTTIPIVALTADVTTADLEKCREAGMNDYISKPVDEKILYSKIVNQLKKTLHTGEMLNHAAGESSKTIDLTFVRHLTKGDPGLIIKMLALYVEQTPALISQLKAGIKSSNWHAIQTAAHSLTLSFAIIGIDHQYKELVQKVQSFAASERNLERIGELVGQIGELCEHACKECEAELAALNQTCESCND
jgi:CheY-like chemotaxis protein